VEVEPEPHEVLPRRRLTTPDEPGELSDEEFEALRRDLDVDDDAPIVPPRRAPRAAAVVPPPSSQAPAPPPPPAERRPDRRDGNGRAPDEPENDGMVQDTRRPRAGRRNRRHGRPR
jgi:hypothetical protein